MPSKKNKKKKIPFYVFCQNCMTIAPIKPGVRDSVTDDVVYDWHRPCPECGREDWVTTFDMKGYYRDGRKLRRFTNQEGGELR